MPRQNLLKDQTETSDIAARCRDQTQPVFVNTALNMIPQVNSPRYSYPVLFDQILVEKQSVPIEYFKPYLNISLSEVESLKVNLRRKGTNIEKSSKFGWDNTSSVIEVVGQSVRQRIHR